MSTTRYSCGVYGVTSASEGGHATYEGLILGAWSVKLRLVVALVLVAGCQATNPAPPVTPIADETVTIEHGPFIDVAWFGSEMVLVKLEGVSDTTLWAGSFASGFQPLVLPDQAGCLHTRWGRPTRLPDGRLGLALHCVEAGPRVVWDFVAVDMPPTRVERLGAPLMEIHQYSWQPGLHSAWFGGGSLICEGIGAVSGGEVTYLDNVVLEDGDASYSLGDTLRTLDGPDCAGAPRAGWPDWAPDGKTAAFLASLPSGSGVDRLDSEWGLWMYDAAAGTTRKLADGLFHARPLRWSRDGDAIAFGAEIAGQEGTWLYDFRSGSLLLLIDQQFTALDWGPDGSSLVGIIPYAAADEPDGNRLVTVSWKQ